MTGFSELLAYFGHQNPASCVVLSLVPSMLSFTSLHLFESISFSTCSFPVVRPSAVHLFGCSCLASSPSSFLWLLPYWCQFRSLFGPAGAISIGVFMYCTHISQQFLPNRTELNLASYNALETTKLYFDKQNGKMCW